MATRSSSSKRAAGISAERCDLEGQASRAQAPSSPRPYESRGARGAAHEQVVYDGRPGEAPHGKRRTGEGGGVGGAFLWHINQRFDGFQYRF